MKKLMQIFHLEIKGFLINNIEMKSNDGNFKFEGWLTSSNLFKQEGNIFSKNDSIFLVYEFDNLNLNKLNMYLPISNQISGLLVSEGKINGKMSDIVFYMDTNIENPGFDKLSGENLNGTFIYRDSQLYLKGFNFSNQEETYTVSGSLPYDIGIVKSNVNLNTLPLNIMITGKSNQFNILTNNIDNVDYLKGDISLQLSIAGNYNNPRRNGQLVIRNGELSLINLDNFVENINGVAILRNNQLVFEDFKYTRSYNFNKSILDKNNIVF